MKFNSRMNDFEFFKWIIVKDKINTLGSLRSFNEREVWWCNCGKNVGVEINGKGSPFTRPFLVLKKFSRHGFLGVPFTTQEHSGKTWYRKITFNNRAQYAVLQQTRFLSAKRLGTKIGKLTYADYISIMNSLFNLLSA